MHQKSQFLQIALKGSNSKTCSRTFISSRKEKAIKNLEQKEIVWENQKIKAKPAAWQDSDLGWLGKK